MPLQLRIRTINRGALQTFADEWKQAIKPLRKKIGFGIPEAWEPLDKAYFEHPERQAMDPDPARYIARMEQFFIEEVG